MSTEMDSHTGSVPLVLIVENHDDTRLLLRHVVELQGFQVAEARDGEEGLRIAVTLRPALVVIDTDLPRLDGLMVTRRIREVPGVGCVPIIFVSGHTEPEYRQQALAAGASAYFVKPFRLCDLETAVKRVTEKRRVAAR